jgi:hypothetical protein
MDNPRPFHNLRKVHETPDGELAEHETGLRAWRERARVTMRQRAWKARTHLGLREDPECGALVMGIPARLSHERFHDNLIELFADLIDRMTELEEEIDQLRDAMLEQGRFITEYKERQGIN